MLKRTKPSGWSPSSWGLEAGSGAHETRGNHGFRVRPETSSLEGGGSWVLGRHTLQRWTEMFWANSVASKCTTSQFSQGKDRYSPP